MVTGTATEVQRNSGQPHSVMQRSDDGAANEGLSVDYDFCVVGGGILGLAAAAELLRRRPGSSLLLLEKESELAGHQTSHNSGVIHSGVYYQPGSLKAKLCTRGAAALKRFAARHDIPVDARGKLIVATSVDELGRLDRIRERAAANNVVVERIDGSDIQAYEPAIRGVTALLVPATAIVDYRLVAQRFADEVHGAGGEITTGARVVRFQEGIDLVAIGDDADREWRAKQVVVCAGLQADRLARQAGINVPFQIIPFRGEFFRIPDKRSGLIKHLVYPVPDPALPFLGIHFTPTVDGGLKIGPNAVLGFAREGYSKGRFRWRDVRDYAAFPGMWRLASRNVRTGLREMRNSAFRRYYLRECHRYCPELTADDLQPEVGGIRAQAVLRDGTLVDDFLFERTDRAIHVCNAPSPAATSALPIAEHIVDQLLGDRSGL
ncbi:MAG: L-2-hydroxyglutarate oxidase [Acidimicrobiales bacterium]